MTDDLHTTANVSIEPTGTAYPRALAICPGCLQVVGTDHRCMVGNMDYQRIQRWSSRRTPEVAGTTGGVGGECSLCQVL